MEYYYFKNLVEVQTGHRVKVAIPKGKAKRKFLRKLRHVRLAGQRAAASLQAILQYQLHRNIK